MLVRKCNRCNVELTDGDYKKLEYGNVGVPGVPLPNQFRGNADLCNTCYKIFIKFLHTFDDQEGAADNDK